MIVSEINTQITLDFLTQKRENQYFERKGIGEKDTSPTKIANELIGMLNADGGILVLGISDIGEIQDISILQNKLSDYRNLYLDFNDIDTPLLNRYKEKLNYSGDIFDLLVKRHLAIKKEEQYIIKKAGILLFAKDPEKYITSASVRYIRYEGTGLKVGTEHNVVKDERFDNNIPWIIARIKKFLNTTLKDYHFLDLETGRFNKVPEYPEEAWLEGIINALCHRSYNIQGNAIYIKHFDDRLEISNSGPLPAQVNINNIRTERFSRNPRIARTLEDMGFVRQLNEGVSRIYQSMEKSMLSIPEYEERNGNIYLTLRNKISNHSKSIPDIIIKNIQDNWKNYNNTEKKILQHLFYNHEAIIEDFISITGINDKTIRIYLKQFIEQNIIQRISDKIRDRDAKYVFRKI